MWRPLPVDLNATRDYKQEVLRAPVAAQPRGPRRRSPLPGGSEQGAPVLLAPGPVLIRYWLLAAAAARRLNLRAPAPPATVHVYKYIFLYHGLPR